MRKFILTDEALQLLRENLRDMPDATKKVLHERITAGISELVEKEDKDEDGTKQG